MQELFPLACGLGLGALLGALRPGIRLSVGAALAIALGVLATIVTGELESSWEYLLIDIPVVAIAAAAGLAAGEQLARRRTES
jgi:ribose/xylose/arabinose/galactoside ABC-type transport system permease subunit